MINLELRFDGPIPKYLRQIQTAASRHHSQRAEEIYRIKQTKKKQVKKMFVYPSKNHPISQHEKNTETQRKI